MFRSTRQTTLMSLAVPVLIPILIITGGLTQRWAFGHGSGHGGKVWETPPAEVFHDAYDGPPVAGRNMTRVPAIATLEPGNRVHHVRMDIVASEIEIAPGVRYAAWTFGGSVPGPVLHVREGDRVVFTMKNRSGSQVAVTQPAADVAPFMQALANDVLQKASPAMMPMPHSIDFHAGTVAPNDKWRMIMPGDSIRFEWVANYPGVYLYHCGAPPILMHLSMGQYGVVVVSPRDGFPTDADVDREYVVVQSEFYLTKSPESDLYVYDSEAAETKRPSQVAFNGHTTSLHETPLIANAGERVRLYVHNVGPSDTSSFHVVGAIFDRVFYEGNPRNDWAGMQTVTLGASNGAVVEFIAPQEGKYILVDHEFADAQRGAVGFLQVRSAHGQITRADLPPMTH